MGQAHQVVVLVVVDRTGQWAVRSSVGEPRRVVGHSRPEAWKQKVSRVGSTVVRSSLSTAESVVREPGPTVVRTEKMAADHTEISVVHIETWVGRTEVSVARTVTWEVRTEVSVGHIVA